MGNRTSSLPIAQFCGQAPALSSIGAGRAAAMSTAFHARSAKAADALVKLRRLTDEEIAEISEWHTPASIEVAPGITLHYSTAEKELEVCLTSEGRYCKADHPDCVTVGHLDFAWVVELNGMRVAYVADIKRSEWTNADGPDSLQLHGYAQAYADKVGADAYCCGQWAAVEGQWLWGELVELGSVRAVELSDRVLAAAQNVGGDYAMGPHCSGCYGRLHCPAYVLPPELAETSLAPFTNGAELSSEKASELVMLIKRVKDMAAAAEKELKARVERGLVVSDGNGKVWKPCRTEGRQSIDKDALVAAGVAIPMKQGKPYDTWRWVAKP